MDTEQAAGSRRVLKRYSMEDRERLIKEQAQSGLTKEAFCKERGIKLSTFYGWRKKKGGNLASRRQSFAEVDLSGYAQAAVEVLLSNGARIGIRHEGKREDLVALVRGVAGCKPGAA